MNGTAHYSCQIMPPRAHGSGAAPLASLLMEGHGGRIASLTRAERDLLMAWMDSNGLYHGTWNSTPSGCAVPNWHATRNALEEAMKAEGCGSCHGAEGQPLVFESDWFNLQRPELSRILRAPLARGEGLGLGLCRERKAGAEQRVRLLVEGYAHAVKPIDQFPKRAIKRWDTNGTAVVSFASTNQPGYRRMLGIIQEARAAALQNPRVDMPGAEISEGQSRTLATAQ
jgi:hypothetical protein